MIALTDILKRILESGDFLGRPLKKSELIQLFEQQQLGWDCESIFEEFRNFAEGGEPELRLNGEEWVYIRLSGSKNGRKYTFTKGSNLTDLTTRRSARHKSVVIETGPLLQQFLNQHDFSIGGKLINAESLHIIRQPEDLESLVTNGPGCYFIFSTLKQSEIPCFTKTYDGYSKSIEKSGQTFRCLYNGKGEKTRERLRKHLFSESTLEKVLACKSGELKLSNTGALSLESINEETKNKLIASGQLIPAKGNLKPVKKAVKRISGNNHEGQVSFVNGIDIRESKWAGKQFAVCTISTDHELGKILIENAFAEINGYPPLCRRHG